MGFETELNFAAARVLSELRAVDEAICVFTDDPTEDNATGMIQAVALAISAPQPIATAPADRDIMVFNGYFGWYRTRRTEKFERVVWPLYGILGVAGGVWYPTPTHWTELPLIPPGVSALPTITNLFSSARE